VKTHSIAPGVEWIPLFQPDLVNVYLAGDILIDAGGPLARRKLLRFLEGRPVSSHVLTHGHPDHQGCSHAVCERFGAPLLCGEGDREAVEQGDPRSLMPDPSTLFARTSKYFSGPAHPVSRVLSEGDRVGDFTVIATPGHTPGHLAFWRVEDRLLILGDVLFHRNPATRRRGLSEPFDMFTHDPELNRTSARKLAALEPELICFGHGAPLRDLRAFRRFIDGLG
jgi:glyoxylase-like metal-dependent hydrolase (beta-lactamase superfamily II)